MVKSFALRIALLISNDFQLQVLSSLTCWGNTSNRMNESFHIQEMKSNYETTRLSPYFLQDNLFESFVQNGKFVSEDGVPVNQRRLRNVPTGRRLQPLLNHIFWALLTIPPLISALVTLLATGNPYIIASVLISVLLREWLMTGRCCIWLAQLFVGLNVRLVLLWWNFPNVVWIVWELYHPVSIYSNPLSSFSFTFPHFSFPSTSLLSHYSPFLYPNSFPYDSSPSPTLPFFFSPLLPLLSPPSSIAFLSPTSLLTSHSFLTSSHLPSALLFHFSPFPFAHFFLLPRFHATSSCCPPTSSPRFCHRSLRGTAFAFGHNANREGIHVWAQICGRQKTIMRTAPDDDLIPRRLMTTIWMIHWIAFLANCRW